ncbi:tRNA lysidine(34) synthetase TilS [Gephyromycinifex aptenodytis]|uniref:tRNA lysidine(34) synthetase TilS n=1 Tax=Gephyromycinifex aptenodytis TaxID=2716227 RepID=UPI0014483D57|nr:tRNA lysidine(34) synthetase TilS [Gephyromycinifex aptenodytis]
MSGPARSVAATRVAVRRCLSQLQVGPQECVLAAVSGGADSLALAAALAFEAPRAGLSAGAVLVDHGLQTESAQVAEHAADTCRSLRLEPVVVVSATLADEGSGGPEARARQGRYEAIEAVAERTGAVAVLLGHTRDDQAEQVLLGLARGSGARSLAGIPPARGLLRRPFLDLPRQVTESACAEQGLRPWQDPHNSDRRYARVRARAALELLEADLGPGIGAALARSASLLRDDADALDDLAAAAADQLGPGPWPVTELAELAPAVRRRVWRLLARAAGSPIADVSAEHVEALEGLLVRWRGQGGVALPGGRVGVRVHASGGATVRIDSPAR